MAAKEPAAAGHEAQNLSKQSSGDSDFRELEGDITALSHDLRADLDELVTQGAQEIAEIIGERMELEPDLVVAETVAR